MAEVQCARIPEIYRFLGVMPTPRTKYGPHKKSVSPDVPAAGECGLTVLTNRAGHDITGDRNRFRRRGLGDQQKRSE